MNSKICLNLAYMFLLALAVSVPTSAQDNTGLASSGPFAAGASSQDGYTINIDLPQAVVNDVTITDILPQGLIYKSGSLEVSGAADTTHAETVSSPNDGSQPVTITWSFGQVNNSAGQGLILKFRPIVADVPSNKDGTTLAANQVSLQYKDDSGVVQTASGVSDSVKLVEPDLELGLSADPVQGGTATYTASVSHSAKSDADAFDSDLIVVLPSGIVYSPGSAKIISGPAGGTVDASPSGLKWHFDQIGRSWNSAQKVLLSFNATAMKIMEGGNGNSPGEIAATLTWKSAPGDGPGTRRYVKDQSLKAAIYAPDYAVGIGQITDPNPVEAGKILQYAINYSNTGKDAVHGVTIKDSYDQNVTFLSSVPMTDSGKGALWTVGDLKPGESGDIIVEARVNPSAADGTTLKNVVNMASLEASSESIAETTVKVIPRNPTTAKNTTLPQLGANNTSSTQIGNDSLDNATFKGIKIEDLPLVGANNTSSSTQIVGNSENNTTTATTKLSLLPLSQVNNESSTQMGNDSGNSTASTPAKREALPLVTTTEGTTAQLQAQAGNNTTSTPGKQELPTKNVVPEYTYKQIDTNSENNTASGSATKAVPPQAEAAKKAETQTDIQSENNMVTTLQFGDDIKVELVLQKTHLLDDYLVINKSDDISNKPHPATNQPNPATDQTKLGANQSNESIDQTPAAMNKSSLTTSQPDAVSNQTMLSGNQSDQSKGQTPTIEVKPELNINQSNAAQNQPNIEANQSAKPKDEQTPAVEIMPALPAVQPSTDSNQTETGASQSDKPKDQTPVVESKPTIQDNQPATVPTQPNVGASTPDTSMGQMPVVEGNPAATATASQPALGPSLPNVGASTPDTSSVQMPVVESMPAAPASQPSVDLNQTK